MSTDLKINRHSGDVLNYRQDIYMAPLVGYFSQPVADGLDPRLLVTPGAKAVSETKNTFTNTHEQSSNKVMQAAGGTLDSFTYQLNIEDFSAKARMKMPI